MEDGDARSTGARSVIVVPGRVMVAARLRTSSFYAAVAPSLRRLAYARTGSSGHGRGPRPGRHGRCPPPMGRRRRARQPGGVGAPCRAQPIDLRACADAVESTGRSNASSVSRVGRRRRRRPWPTRTCGARSAPCPRGRRPSSCSCGSRTCPSRRWPARWAAARRRSAPTGGVRAKLADRLGERDDEAGSPGPEDGAVRSEIDGDRPERTGSATREDRR